MKLKLIKFTLVGAIAATAIAVLSSFTATDEGSGKYKKPVGNGCTYQCAVQLSDGSWMYWNVPGTYTTCQPVDSPSTCLSTSCEPINPCLQNN